MENKARRLLKSELAKREITYPKLVELLNEAGMEETVSSIKGKLSRGTFSAEFFIDCLQIIGCKTLRLDIDMEEEGQFLAHAA